jgi:hypothetical protein
VPDPLTRSRLVTAVTAASCVTTLVAAVTTAASAASRGGESVERIVVTEQATHQILVLDSDRRSWQKAKVLWRWRPSAANGLADLARGWGTPSEAKLRHHGRAAYLLTTDSLGLAAVVPYPEGGQAYWAANVGPQPNVHSIELLPDGNVAVIASRGGWLRIYTASQGQRANSHAEFPMPGGHGVFWDADTGLLWALGGTDLVALRIGGPPAAPELTEVRRTPLPTPNGHDLQPVAARPGRLWVATGGEVYQYSKALDMFLRDYPGADEISATGVKSVGDDRRSGQVLTALVQNRNLCTWCTDTVTLDHRGDDLTLHGAQIYKARWWVDPGAGSRTSSFAGRPIPPPWHSRGRMFPQVRVGP